MTQITGNKDYKALLLEIKERVYKAQYEALKAVNKELISLYWDIGASIIRRQKAHGWGKSIVENLALDLQQEFPGIHGFSSRNIWYMRTFFTVYSRNTKLQPLVAEIGWAHNIVIMEHCKDDLEPQILQINPCNQWQERNFPRLNRLPDCWKKYKEGNREIKSKLRREVSTIVSY